MRGWIVVADDLTGAAELGAAARRRGLRAVLTRGMPQARPEGAEVWVLDTDSRELPAELARRRLAEVGKRLRAEAEAGARILKKIDSVLRGPVAAECEGLASGLGLERILAVPGNPRRGRVVSGGRLSVEGVPLHESVFRNDPTYPATVSEVALLWAGRGAAGVVPTEVAAEVNSGTLGMLARAGSGDGTLAAGALDFFEACIEALETRGAGDGQVTPPALPVRRGALVVCGSRAGWPAREAWFAARGWPVACGREPRQAEGPRLLGLGARPAGDPADCARELASVAARHILSTRPALICLEGGATAAAVIAALGWESFDLLGEVAMGTAILVPRGEEAMLLLKPGSYPWPAPVEDAWSNS